jgi:hypothetical protein
MGNRAKKLSCSLVGTFNLVSPATRVTADKNLLPLFLHAP